MRLPDSSDDGSRNFHLGNAESGLLDGCSLLYGGAKAERSDDYDKEMCTKVFLDWLKAKVIPKLASGKRNCVLELDRAAYHTQSTSATKPMRNSYTRDRPVDAMTRYGGRLHGWPHNYVAHRQKTKTQLWRDGNKHAFLRHISPGKWLIPLVAEIFSSHSFFACSPSQIKIY